MKFYFPEDKLQSTLSFNRLTVRTNFLSSGETSTNKKKEMKWSPRRRSIKRAGIATQSGIIRFLKNSYLAPGQDSRNPRSSGKEKEESGEIDSVEKVDLSLFLLGPVKKRPSGDVGITMRCTRQMIRKVKVWTWEASAEYFNARSNAIEECFY